MIEKFSSTLSFYLRGLAVITALFLANPAVYAQSNATDGAPDSYVLDESGAVIPGAKIIELIAEAENLTNRFNANCSIAGCTGAVVNVATASDFGRGASVRPPRRFQFGGRFTF